MNLADQIAREELDALRQRGLLRSLEPLRSRPGPEIVLQPGEVLINLSSNDYLGLAGDPRVGQALADGATKWGAGAGASRLVTGDYAPQHELERALADLAGTEAAVLFNSGYAANLALIPVFAGPDDLILSDALNHASLIDGCRLSRAHVEIYPHCDVTAVDRVLSGAPARRRLVVTDAVFSMDGDLAPLAELRQVCTKYGAILVVDEAHATGVFGPRGSGLCAEREVTPDLRMGTLSKALGVAGAYVAGSRAVCDLMVNRARSLIFSTSLPPALACAALESLRIATSPEGDELRIKLRANVARFARELQFGRPARAESPIVPLVLGAPDRALEVARKLRASGVLAKPIRPPTVPEGTSRIRFALTAAHSFGQVDLALEAVRRALA